jgi:hypothetical protein
LPPEVEEGEFDAIRAFSRLRLLLSFTWVGDGAHEDAEAEEEEEDGGLVELDAQEGDEL